MGKSYTPEIINALKNNLNSNDPKKRDPSIMVLSRIGPKQELIQYLPLFMKLLSQKPPATQVSEHTYIQYSKNNAKLQDILTSLTEKYPNKIIPYLQTTLNQSSDPIVKLKTLTVFSDIAKQNPQALLGLFNDIFLLIGHENKALRACAARITGTMGAKYPDKVIARLIYIYIKTDNPQLKQSVIIAFASLGPHAKIGLPFLYYQLKDKKHEFLQDEAAKSLGKIILSLPKSDQQKHIRILQNMLKQNNAHLTEGIIKTLGVIRGPAISAADDLINILHSTPAYKRGSIEFTLAYIGAEAPEAFIPKIQSLLNHPDINSKISAVKILKLSRWNRIGIAFVPVLLEQLNTDNFELASQTASTVSSMVGSKHAAKLMRPYLNSPYQNVRFGIIEAIVKRRIGYKFESLTQDIFTDKQECTRFTTKCNKLFKKYDIKSEQLKGKVLLLAIGSCRINADTLTTENILNYLKAVIMKFKNYKTA